MIILTDDALCRLAQAVIQDAVRVTKSDWREAERRDAAQFLVAHDGAELWLKIAGIGVTKRMRGDLKLMALGRFERSRNG